MLSLVLCFYLSALHVEVGGRADVAGVDAKKYSAHDVIEDPALRNGIKLYTCVLCSSPVLVPSLRGCHISYVCAYGARSGTGPPSRRSFSTASLSAAATPCSPTTAPVRAPGAMFRENVEVVVEA
jgi:hypothetical protein